MSELETLIECYQRSTPPIRRRGRTWYPEALRMLSGMAQETGRTTAQAVAVFAITSANTQLLANIRYTEAILKGERMYGCYPVVQTPLVSGALSTTRPKRFVTGPKCSAFYKAIMGDVDSLVLDRWAARAAGADNGRGDIGRRQRRLLDAAYREAAEICGETVRAFQAIVWIVTRESTPKSSGVIPRLADITR